MKTSDVLLEEVPADNEDECCAKADEFDLEITTDEDFFDAINLLESTRYLLLQLLRHRSSSLSDGTKRVIIQTADEIKQFTDLYVPCAETDMQTVIDISPLRGEWDKAEESEI